MTLIENKIAAGFGSLALKYKTGVDKIYLLIFLEGDARKIAVFDAASFSTPEKQILGTENFEDVISFNGFERMLGAVDKTNARVSQILGDFSQRVGHPIEQCGALLRMSVDGAIGIRLCASLVPKEQLMVSDL